MNAEQNTGGPPEGQGLPPTEAAPELIAEAAKGPPPPPLSRGSLASRFVRDATGAVAGHPVAGIVTLILFMDLVGTRPSLAWFAGLLLATGLRVVFGHRAG